jgi:hypothetical protein
MCKRSVTDLTAMDDAGRVAFLASCEGEVCVSYKLPLRPALAAAAMAAAVVSLPVAAAPYQDDPTVAAADVTTDAAVDDQDYGDIMVGGIKDPKNTEFVEDAADAKIPEMPVTYEVPAKPAAAAAKPAR